MNQIATKIAHEAEQYGLRPEASQYPMMLVLSFVYPCNALCPHCPYTNSSIRKEYRDAPYMPEALFKKIAESQLAFAKRAVQWEQDTVVNRKMAFDHYFGPNAKKPI